MILIVILLLDIRLYSIMYISRVYTNPKNKQDIHIKYEFPNECLHQSTIHTRQHIALIATSYKTYKITVSLEIIFIFMFQTHKSLSNHMIITALPNTRYRVSSCRIIFKYIIALYNYATFHRSIHINR